MPGDHGHKPGDDPRGDDELSRVYREGAREEPPAELDGRILAAARREAGRTRRPRLRRLSSAWTVPVSLAAVIVLSVSLVLVVQLEDERARAPLLEETPTPSADSAPGDGEEARTAAPATERLEPAAPEPLPEHRPELTVPSRESLRQREDSAASAGGAQKRRAFPSEAEAPEARTGAGERSLAAPPSAPPPPHVWLAEIEQLLAAGEVDAARENLARFRERYPDYPVPASVSAGVTAPSPE
ncbi:MAG: hypothetical protein GWN84_04580 [Gammaproteobacteria bacterium]|nr:hypothetical protein [Gammaproteobacteria bacterium]NIR82252.1 hypothetical protein [Gammaproteobacteria bacterium]NIR91183.1 hypothetical protein [Gammaproteobacteria bacterium]NIU03401.1 hypothetical protein [Gammaproteobacteria bacterium]NIX84676.1 hypothetical protein [Gammaproteobacteria bacterium]